MPNTERIVRDNAKGRIGISHYQGDLHTHSKSIDATTPDEITEQRRGSNCGRSALEVMAQYYGKRMATKFMAVTEHSRDGDPEAALTGVTAWFNNLYLNNPDWLKENFGKTAVDLEPNEREQVMQTAREQAEQLVGYQDERLEHSISDVEQLSERRESFKVLKGVEANLLPDGNFDTPMISQGRFEIVNCSIHPNVDRIGFQNIVNNAEKYSALVETGIKKPETNIMCHIGFGCPDLNMDSLNWENIAQAAIDNNVALEINLSSLMRFLTREMLDFNKYPESNTAYREFLRQSLPKLIPILSSPAIAEKLKPFFADGLKIAINTDEHGSGFIEQRAAEENGIEGKRVKVEMIRFWRCLKIVEEYFNQIFQEFGISKNNIINTFSAEELENFLA